MSVLGHVRTAIVLVGGQLGSRCTAGMQF